MSGLIDMKKTTLALLIVASATCPRPARADAPLADVLGFEESALWSSTDGSGSLVRVPRVSEGDHALALGGSGWRRVRSEAIAPGAVGDALSLDLVFASPTAGWESVGVVLEIPSAQLYWEDLGSTQVGALTAGQLFTLELPISAAARTALATGAELFVNIIVNGGETVTLDRLRLAASPTPPDESGPAATECLHRDLEIVDIQSDFRDIWAGREDVATGKTTDSEPSISVRFNDAVQPQRLAARLVGLTAGTNDSPSDCVDAWGDTQAASALHEVTFLGGFGAEAWRSELGEPYAALGAPLDFNLVAFESVSGIPDVQGALAVGGDLTLQSFAINQHAHKPLGLVVAGGLALGNGTITGDIAYGSVPVTAPTVTLSGIQSPRLPFSFGDLQRSLEAMSQTLAGRDASGAVTLQYSQLKLVGTDPEVNVFTVSSGQLAQASSVVISTPSGATALINVPDPVVSVKNLQISLAGVTRGGVLWNLPQATALSLANISFQGSMLAPLAEAVLTNGNFEGTLVARAVRGTMEFHDFPLVGWEKFGAARATHTVSLRPNSRLRAGCEYVLQINAYPATHDGNCLAESFSQSFLVAEREQEHFDREVSRRRFERSTGLPTAFEARPGVNTLTSDVFERYASTLKLRRGIDAFVATGAPVASRVKPGLQVRSYRQHYRGIPILGASYLVHEEAGVFRGAVGSALPSVDLPVTPAFDAAQAVQKAVDFLGSPSLPGAANGGPTPTAELWLKPTSSDPSAPHLRLVWRVTTPGSPSSAYVDLDAQSGLVMFTQPRRKSINDCGGVELDTATWLRHEDHSVFIPFTADHSIGATDMTLGVAEHAGGELHAFETTAPLKLWNAFLHIDWASSETVTNDICLDTDDQTQLVARSHWSVLNAARTFSSVFGWHGVRNDPSYPLYVVSVQDESLLPSQWQTAFTVGGADPDQIVIEDLLNYPSVVAHEYSHGVSYYTRKAQNMPERGYEGESGAMEEAYGDIMAALVTQRSTPGLGNSPWCLPGDEGQGCTRDMANPNAGIRPGPDTYRGLEWGDSGTDPCDGSNDNCFVHRNSTLVSHWFYTLVNGKDATSQNDLGCATSVTPLDPDPDVSMRAAAELVFASFAVTDANSTMAAAREVTASVAEAMAPDPNAARRSVERAWHAVGVGEGAKPGLLEPLDGATEFEPWLATLKFEVGDSVGPWIVRYSTSPDFANAATAVTSFASTVDSQRMATFYVNLDAGKTYYWQGREGDSDTPGMDWAKCGAFSASFTTSKKAIKLRVPSAVTKNGYYLTNNMGQLVWEDVKWAGSYEAIVRDSDDGCSAVSGWSDTHGQEVAYLGDTIDQNLALSRNPTKLRPNHAFDPDRTYHLYVRAVGPQNAKGECNHFKVRKLKLLPFQKVSPLKYDTVAYDSGGPFVWTPSVGAERYQLTIRRWPPEPGPSELVHTEMIDAATAHRNSAGQIEHTLGATKVTRKIGEHVWTVRAFHASGDSRNGWDEGAPRFTDVARFWNGAERITVGETEHGEHAPFSPDGTIIDLIFPRNASERQTQTCFDTPGNTLGMRWYFSNSSDVDWDAASDAKAGSGQLCTGQLDVTDDIMYLTVAPYSNEVHDFPAGFGPVSRFGMQVGYCGGVGDACCEEGAKCVKGAICADDECVACGGEGEPCCGSKCDKSSLICEDGECAHCGDRGESCCAGNACASDAQCKAGQCAACGGKNEPCCGDSCADSNTECSGGYCQAIARCSEYVTYGADSPSTYDIEMGVASGPATMYVNTFSKPDNLHVWYEGKEVMSTGCFGTATLSGCNNVACCDGSGECSIRFNYGPGSSTKLTVQVAPNCAGTSETEWRFMLSCPR